VERIQFHIHVTPDRPVSVDAWILEKRYGWSDTVVDRTQMYMVNAGIDLLHPS